MRSFFVLILIAILLAFMAGYTALSLRGSNKASVEDIIEINREKLKFIQNISPYIVINFDSLFYEEDQVELMDSTTLEIPRSLKEKAEEHHFASSNNCYEGIRELLRIKASKKILIWEEFRCGRLTNLPYNFFSSAPFMHPVGKSYAFLAYLTGVRKFRTPQWLRSNFLHFHVLELSNISNVIDHYGGSYSVLSSFKKESLDQLYQRKNTILNEQFLLVRRTYHNKSNGLEYHVFHRSNLNSFLKNSRFTLTNYQPGRSCFYKEDGLCWNYNIRHVFQIANFSTITLLIGLVIIILIVVHSLLSKIKEQREEDEKRRLALRVLTHEFRTPVASLMLLVERFIKRFDDLNEREQEILLSINSEVYRLKKLVETSRKYLKAEKGGELIDFKFITVDSINEHFDHMINTFSDQFEENIIFESLEEDIPMELDPYWLEICLKNIVENAFEHGKPPVKLSLKKDLKFLHIIVEDQGICEFDSFDRMKGEFVKGTKSSGTGLGTNIVYRVIDELGGKITLDKNPTTISVCIPLNTNRRRII